MAAFDGVVDPADIVNTARAFVTAYGGTVNAFDCHWMATTIAAAAGATLDPVTQNLNPASNQSGGFWRVVHQGSSNPVDNWQTLVQPGDIVRMGWTGGGFHTIRSPRASMPRARSGLSTNRIPAARSASTGSIMTARGQ